jgi:hypothetical protein
VTENLIPIDKAVTIWCVWWACVAVGITSVHVWQAYHWLKKDRDRLQREVTELRAERFNRLTR